MSTYKLTLIAMLAALAVAGRIAMAHLPNIQPVTAVIIITGFWLGPLAAVIMAFLTTFLSNVILGMGIWSVWQVISWSVIGLIAGLIGKYWPSIPTWCLVVYGFFSGLFFGFMISITMYTAGQPFWGYYVAGIPMDLNHSFANAVFIALLSPVLGTLFNRYQKRHALN
ncbi:ECF transporter S component [Halobacillus sp. A5]|uniref:ECF transporter S component n=1 Tax=Halobacillus sp. A5 TaxID=2880263 RepID=UPI0020A6CADC|nr:ECF transporter S component [Halobacillus sp. A5]MCP3025820.1 ECF transporter S component [Halobacillus sp. A5]